MRPALPIALGLWLAGGGWLAAEDTVEILREQQEDFIDSPPDTPWWKWDAATGDWFGARPQLQDRGIEIFGGYNYTLQSALSTDSAAGSHWIYSGMLDYGVQLDLEKLVGWKGATVQTLWMWIHGNTVEESIRDDLLISSDLAGFETFRMLDLWFQQNLLDDRISLRLGQFTADTEFLRSAYSAVFLNRSSAGPPCSPRTCPAADRAFPWRRSAFAWPFIRRIGSRCNPQCFRATCMTRRPTPTDSSGTSTKTSDFF